MEAKTLQVKIKWLAGLAPRTTRGLWRGAKLLWREPRALWWHAQLVRDALALERAVRQRPLLEVLDAFAPPVTAAPVPNAPAPQCLANWLDRLLRLNRAGLRPICWRRAIVLHCALARQGIATRILFGVRKGNGASEETQSLPPLVGASNGLTGHAWLERAGQPYLEKTPPDYVVTYQFPPA